MILKKHYKILIVFVLQGISFCNACIPTEKIYNNKPWEFINQKLFVKPEKTRPINVQQKITSLAGAGISTIPGLLLGKIFTEVIITFKENCTDLYPHGDNKQHILPDLLSCASSGCHCLTLLTAIPYATYKILEHMTKNDWVQYEAFEEFVKNWQIYKPYTPTELHAFFDEVSTTYLKTQPENVLNETFTIYQDKNLTKEHIANSGHKSHFLYDDEDDDDTNTFDDDDYEDNNTDNNSFNYKKPKIKNEYIEKIMPSALKEIEKLIKKQTNQTESIIKSPFIKWPLFAVISIAVGELSSTLLKDASDSLKIK